MLFYLNSWKNYIILHSKTQKSKFLFLLLLKYCVFIQKSTFINWSPMPGGKWWRVLNRRSKSVRWTYIHTYLHYRPPPHTHTQHTYPPTLEWGANREDFDFKLAMVKTCSTWPILNKYMTLKFLKWVFRPHYYLLLPQTLYIAYGKGQKLKIWILFLPWSKCIHSNLCYNNSFLKGIIITFKQKLDMIYRPHGPLLSPKWLF